MRASGEVRGAYRSECRALIEWAATLGRTVSFSYVEQFERVAEGAEHVVFHDRMRAVAVKATHINRFGHSARGEGVAASPLEYLRRLAWQNTLFGDDVRIDGVASDEGQIEVVTTQRWINADLDNPTPSAAEIDAYFSALGFTKVEVNAGVPLFFHHGMGLLVADAHERNVLRSETGEMMPIDVVIGSPGPELRAQIEATLPLSS